MQMDSAIGIFLHGLDSLHLRDSVLVVVTGDHRLPYTAEFSSFGYGDHYGNLDFIVPFLLCAPGIIPNRIELPYSTSHVDIAYHLFLARAFRRTRCLYMGRICSKSG
jgi:membrane-anchored protein YejM (alkaline phosphatase superfamily)